MCFTWLNLLTTLYLVFQIFCPSRSFPQWHLAAEVALRLWEWMGLRIHMVSFRSWGSQIMGHYQHYLNFWTDRWSLAFESIVNYLPLILIWPDGSLLLATNSHKPTEAHRTAACSMWALWSQNGLHLSSCLPRPAFTVVLSLPKWCLRKHATSSLLSHWALLAFSDLTCILLSFPASWRFNPG